LSQAESIMKGLRACRDRVWRGISQQDAHETQYCEFARKTLVNELKLIAGATSREAMPQRFGGRQLRRAVSQVVEN
jgi:hypothetical protein